MATSDPELLLLQFVEQRRNDMITRLNKEEQADLADTKLSQDVFTRLPHLIQKWNCDTSVLNTKRRSVEEVELYLITVDSKVLPTIRAKIAAEYQQKRQQLDDPKFMRQLLLADKKDQEAPSIFVSESEFVEYTHRFCAESVFRNKIVEVHRKRTVEKNPLTGVVRNYGPWSNYDVEPKQPEERCYPENNH